MALPLASSNPLQHMTRSFLRVVARGMVGVLITAQLAISAYACPALSATAQMQMPASVATTDESSNTAVGVPMAPARHCNDMGGAMDATSPNLCAEHCKQGQQSDQAATLTVPAAVFTALYATPLLPVTAAPPRPAAATLSALVAAAPPHAIAHCVYRI
jgi:hypothetical protein